MILRMRRICLTCQAPLSQPSRGRPKLYCGESCIPAKNRTRHSYICAHCSEPFVSRQNTPKYCSPSCAGKAIGLLKLGSPSGKPCPWRKFASKADQNAHHSNRRRLGINAVSGESYSRSDIFERDNWICGICHGSVDRALVWPHPSSVSIDHVVPLSRGGGDCAANVQCAHLGCNSRKCDGRRLAAA